MRTRTLAVPLAAALVAAVLATAGCTTSTSVTTTNGPLPDTATAVGIGTASAAPDKAIVSLGVTAKGKTGVAATDAASKAMNLLLAALDKAGVTKDEIQTEQVSLNPSYDRTGKPSGFDAFQSVTVTTKKLDKLSAILTAATGAGATTVNGPRFVQTSENSARAAAIAKAIADARSRAEAMAKASGRSLAGVLSVSEVADAGSPYTVYGASDSSAMRFMAPSVPVQPGTQEQTARVSVVFRLK